MMLYQSEGKLVGAPLRSWIIDRDSSRMWIQYCIRLFWITKLKASIHQTLQRKRKIKSDERLRSTF